MLYISLLVMDRLNSTLSAIFIPLVYSLLPKDLTVQNLFIFPAAGVVPCDGRTSSRTSS